MKNWKKYYLSVFDDLSGVKDWEIRLSYLKKWTTGKEKVLDLACSLGIPSFIFKNYLGIEIHKGMIRGAKKHGIKMKFMDIEKKFNLTENNYDLVLALNIIEHVRDPDFFLKQIKRILKKNGRVVFSTPNCNIFRKFINPIDEPEHLSFWNIPQFKNFLRKNGFKILDVGYVGRIKNPFFCQTFMVLSELEKS